MVMLSLVLLSVLMLSDNILSVDMVSSVILSVDKLCHSAKIKHLTPFYVDFNGQSGFAECPNV
jgi:hypothetical protein